MATLAEIERALAKAKDEISRMPPLEMRSSIGGTMGGGVVSVANSDLLILQKKIERLEKARQVELLKEVKNDPNANPEAKDLATSELNRLKDEARRDPKAFKKEIDQTNKDLGEILGRAVEEDTRQKAFEDELDDYLGSDETPVAGAEPKKQVPVSKAEPARPPLLAAASPEAPPTAKDVKSLTEDVQQIKEETELERKIREERAKMLLMEEKAAQEQRRIASLTPAQRLQEQVRAREQTQLERGKSAVAERREQMAAREMGKAADVMSGSFREGDVTQIVDPSEREAASNYFKQRAEDIRKGQTTAQRPTFAADRSLTVVEIDPAHRARGDRGIGIGHSPQFGGEASKFFGPDRSQMQSEMIGGKPVPVMTGEQAMATQSRGTGINQYEKTGSWQEQLDARSARDIRMRQGQQEIDEKLEYALTGKMPKRMEEERRKKTAQT